MPRLPAALDALGGRLASVPRGLLIGIGVLLVAAVAGNMLYARLQAQASIERQAALEREVGAIAGAIAKVVAPRARALEAVAQDPRVVAALSGHDDAARNALAQALQADIKGALRLRLIPRGTPQTDPDASPPLTYESLDLLLKAEQSARPPGAEVHLAGKPDEHLALARRAPPDGEPVGFVHLSLETATLRGEIAKIVAGVSDATIEVRQPVPGAPPIMIARAGAEWDKDAASLTKPIPGTAWLLAAHSRGDTDPAITWNPVYLLVIAVPLLAVVGVLRRAPRGASGSTSATVYTGAIKAIMAGEHPSLAQLLPGAGNHPRPAAAASAPPLDDAPARPAVAETPSVPPPAPPTIPAMEAHTGSDVPASIFRAYDIRGVVGETLTPEGVYQIGRAFGAEAAARNQQTVIVARDGRHSSVSLRGALVEGLRDAGRDVLDIGLTPSPVLYFATHYLDTRTGVMITGSHNPAEYNGLKLVLDGETLSGEAIQAIRTRIEAQDFTSGTGSLQEIEIIPDYIRRISEDIPVSLGDALKVVVDCGNGVPGIVAPHILRAIGHDVIELYCEVDGDFPNHHPDPSDPANLEDLIAIVRHEQADLGLAFDGDGDRLGVVDREGNILWPDRQMMLFATDVLSRNPGARIIYDVKCSRLLAGVIRDAGGEPIMSRSGHSLIKQKMKETGALLGGEMSGHIFFKERWYGFDDALYSAARLLEILVNANEPPEQVFARLPQAVSTPELKLAMPEARHAEFMQALLAAADFPDAEKSDLDGLRVDFADGFGLVRPSNTTPCLVLRFEGDTPEAMSRIMEAFRALMLHVDPALELPF